LFQPLAAPRRLGSEEWKAWNAGVGDMNKQVGGAVAVSVGTGGRWVGKVVRSAWWLAALAAVGIGTVLGVTPALAQDATWLTAPTVAGPVAGSFDFDNNANWATAGGTTPVPGSMTQTGTATFGMSAGTSISFSAPLNALDGFTFLGAASNYAFFTNGTTLALNGLGIVVNGDSTVSFTNSNGGSTGVFKSSPAGSATITNNNNSLTQFGLQGGTATATAGNATIMNNGGSTVFPANTTAGSAKITNNGGVTQFGSPGSTDTATAGNATIMNNGGVTGFFASTTADSATITNNSDSSSTQFNDTSNAGAAHITNSSGGNTSFFNASTAFSATITNSSGGLTQFGQTFGGTDTASAGTATITNNSGGFTQFFAGTTAFSAMITNNSGGSTQFGLFEGTDTASAGNAHITNNSGGLTNFFANTTAGSATITNNGGNTQFGGFGGTG
jgi:hypothetical protein